MNIGIFCSANDLDEKYTTPAKALVALLAKAGHTLVWGGSNNGLMKVVADTAQQNGGRLLGITIESFKDYARRTADELIVAKDTSERKAALLKHSDALVMLVGGLGTLDEATEVLELKKLRLHRKTIVILNTGGFYDGLKMQLERIAAEGFLPVKEQYGVAYQPLSELVQFVDTPEEVAAIINERGK